MSDQDEKPKPKQKIEIDTGGRYYYAVADLLVIMKNRSSRFYYYFGEEVAGLYRGPFDIPAALQVIDDEGEKITNKQRRKLMRRYMHEWNVYLAKYSKPVEAPEEYLGYWRRN